MCSTDTTRRRVLKHVMHCAFFHPALFLSFVSKFTNAPLWRKRGESQPNYHPLQQLETFSSQILQTLSNLFKKISNSKFQVCKNRKQVDWNVLTVWISQVWNSSDWKLQDPSFEQTDRSINPEIVRRWILWKDNFFVRGISLARFRYFVPLLHSRLH